MTSANDGNSNSDIYVTILAGGSGTRLWPLSRKALPKQFLQLCDHRSMLQSTVDRVLQVCPLEHVFVLTGPEHAHLVHEQIEGLPKENVFIEPGPRNTAPCLGLAAMRLAHMTANKHAVMASIHADHAVQRPQAFAAALRSACQTARQGYIATVGIVPTEPHTGYGYIEKGAPLYDDTGCTVYAVSSFVEKPPLDQARDYVNSGNYLWNTGYFAWTLERILGEFERSLPETFELLHQVVSAERRGDALAAASAWNSIKPVAIDVGIMEKADHVAVIPCEMGWNDVGSWASLYELAEYDEQGNVLLGDSVHVSLDTHNTLVSSSKRLVATAGLEDYIIVDTEDALLILPRERAQDVSSLVKQIRAKGLEEHL